MTFLRKKTGLYDRKKREHNLRFLYSILAVIFIFGIIIAFAYFVLFSNFLKVKSTETSGLRIVSKDELVANIKSTIISKSFLGSILGPDNILFWKNNSGEVTFGEMLPKISSVSINTDLKTRTVKLFANERIVYGVWCVSETECFAFDSGGVVFSRVPTPEGVLLMKIENLNMRQPVLGSKFISNTDWIENLFTTYEIMQKNNIPIEKIIIKDYSLKEWEAISPLRFSLYFSFDFIPDNLNLVLKNFFSRVDFNSLSYIDFRIPNRLFYK